MQNQNLLTITTTLSSVEDTGSQIKVKDANGNTYSFFKQLTAGGNTAAFNTFQQVRQGETVTIVYKEVPYKNTKLKNVVKFRAPEPKDSIKAPEAGSPRVPASSALKYSTTAPNSSSLQFTPQSRPDLALRGYVNGLLAAGVKPSDIQADTLQQLKELDTRVSESLQPGTSTLPVIQQENVEQENIRVEDVPF